MAAKKKTAARKAAKSMEMVGSSGRQRIRNSCFSDFHLGLPVGSDLLLRFEQFSGSCLARIKQARLQSESLSGIRDILLPRLLSGELTIPDAEKLAADAL